MALSIAERMARQARIKHAANVARPASASAGNAGAAMSVADRIRKQAAYKAAASVPAKPPSAEDRKATLTVAERIAKAAAAKRREMQGWKGDVSGASNQALIAKYKDEYKKFLAQLDTMDFGAMFFNPAAPEETKEAPAEVKANANGISTAEGEFMFEAVPAESETRLNEVPVTVPEEKPSRPKRFRKAKAKAAEEPAEPEMNVDEA